MTGSLTADEFILQFKAEASQTDLGEAALIEYLKAGLHQSLFKSIYQLPVWKGRRLARGPVCQVVLFQQTF